MDIIEGDLSYVELQKLYEKYFSLRNLGANIEQKFGLIGLICYLYDKLKANNPDLTHWQLVWKLGKDTGAKTDLLKGLAVVCSDFSYACSVYPNFGLKDKEIPGKIKELLKEYLPF